MIIEEYINLQPIHNDLAKKRSEIVEQTQPEKIADSAPKLIEPQSATTPLSIQEKSLSGAVAPAKKVSQFASQKAKLINFQEEQFKNLKQNGINTLKTEVSQFNELMKGRIKELEQKLNERVEQRLYDIYDNFDNLPESQKQYFLNKLKKMKA